ncbi:MAG: tetratricopeptide repeat protein [Bacteroidota bacterium]|nr:tetratricopeptide repeat protein [Bacteroidota bacterium]
MAPVSFIYNYKFLFFTLCAFLLYGNTLKNTYALDDNFVTTSRSNTSKGLSAVKEIFTSHYIVEEGGINTFEYRPLVKLSYAIEHEIFGVKPLISHGINILLYGLCLFILFLMCSRLFADYPPLFSELVVIFFAFIPLHCEVVASLKNRDILLSFIFSGLCFLYLLKFSHSKNFFYLLAAWLCFSISLLSKLDSLTLIVIFPLLLIVQKRVTIAYAILILITLVIGYYTFDTLMNILVDQSQIKRPVEFYENPLFVSDSFALRLTTALNSLGFYFKMLFIPYGMAAYYGYDTLHVFDLVTLENLIAVLGTAGSVALIIVYLKDLKNPIMAGLVIFFISLSMYLNLLKPVPGIVADRFAFIPSIGFSVVFVYLLVKNLNGNTLPQMFSDSSKKFRYVFILILCANFLFVFSRNSDWKNSLHLYTQDIKAQPRSLKLHNLFGNEIISEVIKPNSLIPNSEKQKYVQKAEASLKTVLSMDSLNIKALNNLSFIYLNFYRDYQTAKTYISRAYAIDSNKHEIVYNLALAHFNLNEFTQSRKYIHRAFRLKPEDDHTLELMSVIYSDEKIAGEGINIIQKQLTLNPQSFKLNLLLGNLYIAKADTASALRHLGNASRMKPGDGQLLKIIDVLNNK